MAFVLHQPLSPMKINPAEVASTSAPRRIPRLRMSSEVSSTASRVDLGPLQVSPIGVGTWAWGDELYWGRGDEKEQKQAFEASVNAGVNLFDTAEVYALGESERRCGRFLRSYQRKSPDRDENIVIATKFAPLIPFRFSSESVVEACKRSAERLGVDSIDLYQLHWPGLLIDNQYWDGIAKCYSQGLIKAAGVSNYGPERLLVAHRKMVTEREVPLVTNQVLYNLVYRKPEKYLMELCESLGIKILAYSPFAQGVLTGKYETEIIPRGARGSTQRSMQAQTTELRALLREIADRRGRTMAQVSLNWILAKGAIPIPGAKNVKQAEENAGALGWSLEADEVQQLDNASAQVGDIMRGIPVYDERFVPK